MKITMDSANDGVLAERGRALESEWFRKRERAAIARLRRDRETAAEVDRLADRTGVDDPALMATIVTLGFDADTIDALDLLPAVELAWLEGGVSARERATLLDLADELGLVRGGAAHARVVEWLDAAPSRGVLADGLAVLARLLEAMPPERAEARRRRLRAACDRVARAAGGILGWRAVSDGERAFLERLDRVI